MLTSEVLGLTEIPEEWWTTLRCEVIRFIHSTTPPTLQVGRHLGHLFFRRPIGSDILVEVIGDGDMPGGEPLVSSILPAAHLRRFLVPELTARPSWRQSTMRIENSIGGRVDLAPIGITGRAEIAALIMGLPFQGHLVFGITFAGFNHGRALVAMSLQEARALADAVTKVVAATEVGSKGADAVMRLERGRSTVEFAALLPTEKEPQPGWELSILTQATIGHASATVTVDAQQVRGILAELTKIADAVEAFVTFEEGLADERGPAELEHRARKAVDSPLKVTPDMPPELH